MEKIFSKRIFNLSLSMHNWSILVVLFYFERIEFVIKNKEDKNEGRIVTFR